MAFLSQAHRHLIKLRTYFRKDGPSAQKGNKAAIAASAKHGQNGRQGKTFRCSFAELQQLEGVVLNELNYI